MSSIKIFRPRYSINKVYNPQYSKINHKFTRDFLTELNNHPIVLNPLIEAVIPEIVREKTLNFLDSNLFLLNKKSDIEDEEDDSEIISKLFEVQEKSENRAQFLNSSTSFNLLQALKENLKEPTESKHILIKEDSKPSRVYCKAHFKWLLDQGENHKLLKFDNKRNARANTSNNLEKKIIDFCKWAEEKYDCRELELDAITLMKIFLVNYDKGPVMWVPVNIEEIFDKNYILDLSNTLQMGPFGSLSDADQSKDELKEKTKPENTETSSPITKSVKYEALLKRFDYGKWYLHKKYWLKKFNERELKDPKKVNNVLEEDAKLNTENTNTKLMKYTGVKLFYDFFKDKKSGRVPYFLKSKRKKLHSSN